MVSRAVLRYIRLSPRKVRQVIDLIRGKDISSAEAILANLNKRPAYYVLKLLRSAVANAEYGKGSKGVPLYISKITADGGPVWKRYRAAPFGRAVMIRRRTCHISLELDKIEESQTKPRLTERSKPR